MKTTDSEVKTYMNNKAEIAKLPERIKLLRRVLSMTQTEFANYVQLSQSQISAIEQGQRKPSPKTLKQIARICECNEIWLMYGVEETDLIIAEKNKNKQKYINRILEITNLLDETKMEYLKRQAELLLDMQIEETQKSKPKNTTTKSKHKTEVEKEPSNAPKEA